MLSPRKFEKHIFISYAHLDNQPLTPEQQGWISRFHASLSTALSTRLGRKAEIWRDQKLAGNDVFADEIMAQFPKTALLISVLTPRYIQSNWCTREVQEFCKAAEQSGGVVMGNKSRVIKVIKTPIDNEEALPPVMKKLIGYPFYVMHDEHAPLELDPAFGKDLENQFCLKVVVLASHLAEQIKKLEEMEVATPAATAAAEPSASKPTIYLAECSWDQRDAREKLEAELRYAGYPIIPDRQLPRNESSYVTEVTQLLNQAKLSIHLIGASYNPVPDGPSGKSIVVLQNELAAARSAASDSKSDEGLKRVIWIPENLQSQQLEQQRFIETLHSSAEAQFGADLIVGDFESLKSAVHATLEKLEKPKLPDLPPLDCPEEALIYLICNERDRESILPLHKYLIHQGLNIMLPVFDADAAAVRQAHQDMLTQCDLVIVYYGAGDELWKRAVDSDLRKIKGYRGKKPLLAIYTYLDKPITGAKKYIIDLGEPNLIDGLNGFPEQQMRGLIEKLKGQFHDLVS